jgi:tetratricopeptide (TPR) repeat protein
MKVYDLVYELFQKSKSGEIDPDDFFKKIWEKMVHLTVEERKKMVELSADFCSMGLPYQARHLFTKGMACTFSSDFQNAIVFCGEAFPLFTQLNDPVGCMACSTMTSISYKSIGQLDRAQQFMQQAVKYLDQATHDPRFSFFQSITCYQCGELNMQFQKYEEAEQNYIKGLSFLNEGQELGGRLESGLGIACMYMGKNDQAVQHFQKALDLVIGRGNLLLESKIYSDISLFHLKNKEYKKALENQKISLEIREKNNYLNPACTSYILLAEIFLELKESELAVEFAQKAVDIATKLKTMIKLFEAHAILSKIYEVQGDIKNAFEHYKLFNKYKDEVHNQEVGRKIEQLNTQHKIDSSEKEKEIFRLRNVELKAALDEIHDSFTYARRIQNSLLASEWYIGNSMKRLMKK